ncbi:unnamed protein product [Owenia fusiformis]|uniref:Uncharacterized protein n=1 Tax=Owenia fusiformis TaxID=6347 RepID=A0A8J1UT57_OWEFU|nr:unnamed protein product [Owenia fusiformis]
MTTRTYIASCAIILHASVVLSNQNISTVAEDVGGTSSNATQNEPNIRNHSLVPCSYTIDQSSKNSFMELVNDRNINFMYIKVNFSRRMEIARLKKHRFFSPGYLIWTFKSSPKAGYPLLGYPYDVKILSLGFLTWYVYDHLQVHVDVAPENCHAEWGDDGTMKRLLSTLRDLSNQTIHGETTAWCYGIRFQWDWMNNLIVHWIRVGRDYTGYMCSTLPESPFRFNEVIKQTRFLFFLQVCGVILLCYSPLLLYIFDTSLEGKKEDWPFYSCLKHALIDESETDVNEEVGARDTQGTRPSDNMHVENETSENKTTNVDGGEMVSAYQNVTTRSEDKIKEIHDMKEDKTRIKQDNEPNYGDEEDVGTKSEDNLNSENKHDINEKETGDLDNKSISVNEEVGTKSEGNMNFDDINQEQECDSDEAAEYFFQGDVHISFFVLLNGCFEKLQNSGDFKLKWLLKLLFLIFIVPLVLYIKMIVYYFLLRDPVLARMEQDIPVGFVAVPFGFEASRRNWSYFMGGPYVIYGVFFVLAAEASTYIVLVAAVAAYIRKAIDDYNVIYSNILEETIIISKALQKSKNLSFPHVQWFKFDEFRNPGIKKSLYSFLVEKHQPLRVEHFLTVLYLCIVISFIWLTISVVQTYNQYSELDGVIQLGSSVVFGLIPLLIGWCLRSKSIRTDKKFKTKLRESIVEYWSRYCHATSKSIRTDELFKKKLHVRQRIKQYWSLYSDATEQYEKLCLDEIKQYGRPCTDEIGQYGKFCPDESGQNGRFYRCEIERFGKASSYRTDILY